MRLILVRHGETPFNRDGRAQGQSDGALTEVGLLQAKAAARSLTNQKLAALYTSPQTRAVQTAQAIGEACGLRPRPLKGLRELDLGEVDGLTSQEWNQRFPEAIARFRLDPTSPMPGGESLAQLQRRAWRAVRLILRRHPEETVAAVTHAFALITVLCSALQLPLLTSRHLRLVPGSLTVLHLAPQGRGVVEVFNEHCYLDGLPAQHH